MSTARPSSMYVVAPGQILGSPPPQYAPPPIPEYQPHLEIPDHNWYQQPAAMPEVDHFTNYTATIDYSMNNLNIRDDQHPGWNNGGHPDYNRVPRAWAGPPDLNRNVSPPQSPSSMFAENFAYSPPVVNAPATPISYAPQPPQISSYRAGLKRCVVISGYDGDPVHREVSLQVGQVYDVIPQPDSPCKSFPSILRFI